MTILSIIRRLFSSKWALNRLSQYQWLRDLEEVRLNARILLAELHLDTYCSRRIEFEKIPKIGEEWMKIEKDHRYLEQVLLHEFLTNNIHLNEKERKVAKECVSMVGDFYAVALRESSTILKAMNEIKNKGQLTEAKKQIKYRRD